MQSPKRHISILLPYILEDGSTKVFLQKRSLDQKLPGYFGFWGGGAENDENPEETLIREIKEELAIDLNIDEVVLLNRYEFLRSVKSVYLFKTEMGWEKAVTVGEGEYGKWFDVEEALGLKNIIFEDKVVLSDLERVLYNKPIR